MVPLLAFALIADTGKIQFAPTDHPDKVVAIGDFNDWAPAGTPLALAPDGRTWTASLKLPPGVYYYVICENGQPVPTGDDLAHAEQMLVITPPEYARRPAMRGDGVITASVVRHRADPHDTERINERTFALTIRTRKGDVEAVKVNVWSDGGEQKIYPMAFSATDPLFDYFTVKVVVTPEKPFNYRFLLDDGQGSRAFDSAGLSQGMIGGGQPFRQDPKSYKMPG